MSRLAMRRCSEEFPGGTVPATPRQRRILAGLLNGDLVWEVPHQDFFTQFNEKAGGGMRIRAGELEALRERGWITRVSHDPTVHRLDFWELTQEGRFSAQGLRKELRALSA